MAIDPAWGGTITFTCTSTSSVVVAVAGTTGLRFRLEMEGLGGCAALALGPELEPGPEDGPARTLEAGS
jgi:hypothetical protein